MVCNGKGAFYISHFFTKPGKYGYEPEKSGLSMVVAG